MVSNAIGSGVSALVGIVWVVIAVVIERWCVITPDDAATSNKRNAAA